METRTAINTNAALPNNFFVSTNGGFPYPNVSPSVTVRPIGIRIESQWVFDYKARYENRTSAVINTFTFGEEMDAATVIGDQNGIGLGCDNFVVQSGGSPIQVQPFDVFKETVSFQYRECDINITESGSTPEWALMLDHLTNHLPPSFHGGIFALASFATPGLVTTADVSLAMTTTMAVDVELEELNPEVPPQCGSGPNGQGAGADLRLYGSLDAGSANLVARVDGLTPNNQAATDSFSTTPMGSSNLCIAGNLLAEEVRVATNSIEDFDVDLSLVAPGTTVALQAIYRVGTSFGVSNLRAETVQ